MATLRHQLARSELHGERRRSARVSPELLTYVAVSLGGENAGGYVSDHAGDNGGMLLDVSEGGLAAATAFSVKEGALLYIAIPPDRTHGLIEAVGRVAWSTTSNRRVGVRFVHTSSSTRELLARWISGMQAPPPWTLTAADANPPQAAERSEESGATSADEGTDDKSTKGDLAGTTEWQQASLFQTSLSPNALTAAALDANLAEGAVAQAPADEPSAAEVAASRSSVGQTAASVTQPSAEQAATPEGAVAQAPVMETSVTETPPAETTVTETPVIETPAPETPAGQAAFGGASVTPDPVAQGPETEETVAPATATESPAQIPVAEVATTQAERAPETRTEAWKSSVEPDAQPSTPQSSHASHAPKGRAAGKKGLGVVGAVSADRAGTSQEKPRDAAASPRKPTHGPIPFLAASRTEATKPAFESSAKASRPAEPAYPSSSTQPPPSRQPLWAATAPLPQVSRADYLHAARAADESSARAPAKSRRLAPTILFLIVVAASFAFGTVIGKNVLERWNRWRSAADSTSLTNPSKPDSAPPSVPPAAPQVPSSSVPERDADSNVNPAEPSSPSSSEVPDASKQLQPGPAAAAKDAGKPGGVAANDNAARNATAESALRRNSTSVKVADATSHRGVLVTPDEGNASLRVDLGEALVLETTGLEIRENRFAMIPGVGITHRTRRKEHLVVGARISHVAPQMPSELPVAAKPDGELTVVVRATIGGDGHIVYVDPLSGPMVLIPSVMSAVREWHYQPSTLDGEPFETQADLTLKFRPVPSFRRR